MANTLFLGKKKYICNGNKTKTMKRNKIIAISATALILVALLLFVMKNDNSSSVTIENATTVVADTVPEKPVSIKYGLNENNYVITYDTIKPKDTMAEILYRFGFDAQQVYDITQCPDSILDTRKLRPGQVCALFKSKDSTSAPRYLVYEESAKYYVTFDLSDNYRATRHEVPSEWCDNEIAGSVNSSLWTAIEECGASPQLAVMISEIFGWSIDFFGIQKGDEFRIIYTQEFISGKAQGNFKILAASFSTAGNTVYAIPFTQEGKEQFFNKDGNSLESAFLKAPLDYYRISSKFSNSRYHPVLKRYRAHHGVDYAAPKGTPVYAIGSGKVIKKAYQANGAGYYLKIKHNETYTTSYMHLSGYAKGLKEGDYVQQKQVIGYVGSTGLSTGPHLDFRVYKNGKAIDPLKLESQAKMPISEENKEAFGIIRDSIVVRLDAIPISNTTQSTEKEIVAEP